MQISEKDIELFIKHPHVFGHYLGFEKLTDLHSAWIRRAYLDENFNAMQAHRGSYKTTAIIIVGSIWYLLFYNHDATIGTFRKSDDEAKKIGKTVREIFESKDISFITKFLFNKNSLETSTWSNASITLSIKNKKTPEGSFEARGKSSSITGSHYDIVLPDDLITLKDRISKAERDNTKEIIQELKNNVVNPDGFMFFSGTPWHKDDGWSLIEKMGYKIYQYPINETHLPHITDEYIKELKKGTSLSLYAANYELKNIASEGREFSDPKLGKWPVKSKKITAWLDPAYSGENTTALCLMAFGVDGIIYVTGWVWRQHVESLYNDIQKILIEYNSGTLYIDSTADKGYSARDLSHLWQSVIPRTEKMNKHIKIIQFLKKNWDKLIFSDNCQDEWLEQIVDYQEGQEPDDAPDGLACLCREMNIGYDTKIIVEEGDSRFTQNQDF